HSPDPRIGLSALKKAVRIADLNQVVNHGLDAAGFRLGGHQSGIQSLKEPAIMFLVQPPIAHKQGLEPSRDGDPIRVRLFQLPFPVIPRQTPKRASRWPSFVFSKSAPNKAFGQLIPAAQLALNGETERFRRTRFLGPAGNLLGTGMLWLQHSDLGLAPQPTAPCADQDGGRLTCLVPRKQKADGVAYGVAFLSRDSVNCGY